MRQSARMKRILPLLALGLCTLLASCLTTPVENSGGMGSVTVSNTNTTALIAAMNNVFPQYGYTAGPVNYPDSISFDKPAGGFGKLMYGSYGVTTTFRVKVKMVQVPGTNDYRLIPKLTRVSNAGEAGFEGSTNMMGLWAGEFGPLLKKVQAQAAGAGAGY